MLRKTRHLPKWFVKRTLRFSDIILWFLQSESPFLLLSSPSMLTLSLNRLFVLSISSGFGAFVLTNIAFLHAEIIILCLYKYQTALTIDQSKGLPHKLWYADHQFEILVFMPFLHQDFKEMNFFHTTKKSVTFYQTLACCNIFLLLLYHALSKWNRKIPSSD